MVMQMIANSFRFRVAASGANHAPSGAFALARRGFRGEDSGAAPPGVTVRNFSLFVV